MEGLTNMMEETVLTKIDQLWQTTDFCKCDQCRIDIAAYALNRLPPRYVHSLAGELIHKFDASTIQMDAEITACVYNAIVRIGEDPNHDFEKVNY
ncbi:MAG: late competence development ComFB family protein [Lachnospiraceae bacterium]|nr:late competence development ComFB family protein [Lachnospiraceae bacterium]